MADFPSISSYPWLGQPADPAGSFLRGQQAAIQRRQADEVSRQREQEAALFPLRKKVAEQDFMENALALEEKLRLRDIKINADAHALKLLDQIAPLLKERKPFEAQRLMIQSMVEDPAVVNSELFNKVFQGVTGSVQSEIGLTRITELENYRQQRIDNEKTRLRNALERLRQSGARLDQQAIDLIVDSAKEGFDVSEAIRTIPRQTIPVGPTTEEIGPPVAPAEQKPLAELIKPVERPLTTGTITDLQQGALRASNSLRGIQDAIRFIRENPNAVGPRGVIGEQVEKIAGIINPTFRPTPITDTRTKLRTATTDILRSMRVDSQMSNYERRKLDEIADVSGWIEDPGTAVNQLGVLSDAIVASQLRREKALHRSPSDELLRQLRQAEIASLVQDGLLTVEEAIRWKNLQ